MKMTMKRTAEQAFKVIAPAFYMKGVPFGAIGFMAEIIKKNQMKEELNESSEQRSEGS